MTLAICERDLAQSVYSCHARSYQFGSHHGCLGFANTDAIFDVMKLVFMTSVFFLEVLLMYCDKTFWKPDTGFDIRLGFWIRG